MSNGSLSAPGSNGSNYFVGPPEVPSPATKQAPQVTGTGAVQQAPAAATHTYFVGPPVNPEKMQQPAELAESLTTPHPPPKNRSSFLARWFACICGSHPAPEQ